MPTQDAPLGGSCACGHVRFAVTAPFLTAGYCHCKRCQRRSGTVSTLNAIAHASAFTLVSGGDAVRTWRPPDGRPKSFCERCGGHVFSGDPRNDETVGVRLGAVDGDPGIRPRWRQWLESAPDWDPIPEDGLPRFAQARTID
jgi:hypothetical protein